MIRFVRCALLLLVLTAFPCAHAQRGVYAVNFGTMFDNLENSWDYKPPKTHFTLSLSPSVGLEFEDGKHRLMAGGHMLQLIGDSIFPTQLDYTLFYEFSNRGFLVTAGAAPRTHLVGRYPESFFRNTYSYYHPNFRGVAFSHQSKNGYAEFFCDWYGASKKFYLDEFMLVGSSEYHLFDDHWIVGGNILLNHFANEYFLQDAYLLERLQYNVYMGVNFQPFAPIFETLRVSGGVMATMERLRSKAIGSWGHRLGWQVDLEASIKGFYLKNSTFWGAPQYAYLDRYGERLYTGEVFYNTSFYDRVEVGYRYGYKFLNVFGGVVFHFVPGRVVNQQLLRLEIAFDGFFRPVKKSKVS